MHQRGFTLIEVLVAVLILGVVMMTTLAVFVEKQHRMQQANETILAYQVLSNEAEVRRRIEFAQLESAPPRFITDTSLLSPLQPFETEVSVVRKGPEVKNVTLLIRWRGGQRRASLTLARADTGGSPLW